MVGVIPDAKYHNLREPVPPQAYIPFLQAAESGTVTFEIRATGDPVSLTSSARHAILQADSRLPVFDVKTLTAYAVGYCLTPLRG